MKNQEDQTIGDILIDKMEEAKMTLTSLLKEIEANDASLTPIQRIRMARFVTLEILKKTPMYIGRLNPEWELYNRVLLLLGQMYRGNEILFLSEFKKRNETKL